MIKRVLAITAAAAAFVLAAASPAGAVGGWIFGDNGTQLTGIALQVEQPVVGLMDEELQGTQLTGIALEEVSVEGIELDGVHVAMKEMEQE